MVFLPGDASADDVATLAGAFAATQVEGFVGFGSPGCLPTGSGRRCFCSAEQSSGRYAASLAWVKGWLKDSYGVEL